MGIPIQDSPELSDVGSSQEEQENLIQLVEKYIPILSLSLVPSLDFLSNYFSIFQHN
jgi:hypothetical protein